MLLQITPGLQLPQTRTPVVQLQQDPLADAARFLATLIAQRGAERRAVRRTQAAKTVEAARGKRGAELTPEEREAFKTEFGREPTPDEPIGGELASAERRLGLLVSQATADPEIGSTLASLQTAGLAGVKGTPIEVLMARQKAGKAALARVEELERTDPQTLQSIGMAAVAFGTTPEESIAQRLSDVQRAEVTKLSLESLLDPDSRLARWAVDKGFSLADFAAAGAVGIGNLLSAELLQKANARNLIAEAQAGAARAIATATGADPAVIIRGWRLRSQGRDLSEPGLSERDQLAIEAADAITTTLMAQFMPGIRDRPEFQFLQLIEQLSNTISPVDEPEKFKVFHDLYRQMYSTALAGTIVPNYDQLTAKQKLGISRAIRDSGLIPSVEVGGKALLRINLPLSREPGVGVTIGAGRRLGLGAQGPTQDEATALAAMLLGLPPEQLAEILQQRQQQ